jgi:hypothetical protein
MPFLRQSRLFTAPAILLFAAFLPNATFAQSSKPQTRGRPTICVASAIGQKFEIKTIGLMVFGNDLKTANVGSWGVDSLVVQRLAAGLSSKFSVRPVTLSADVIKMTPPGGGGIFSGNSSENWKAALRDVGRTGCAYIVIAKPYASQYSGTNQIISGLGIVKQDSILKVHLVYAVFSLQLFDGATSEWIRQSIDVGSIFAGAFNDSPNQRTVDESYWPASAEAAAQSAKLREASRGVVASLVNRYTPGILKALNKEQ